MGALTGRKVLLLIASESFRDEEYAEPRKALEAAGATVTVASSKLGTARGMLGGTAKADILLRDAKAADYDAVVFIGGSGATEYWDNKAAHALAQDAAQADKLVGAICIAPVTLARAGLLKGKRATVWPACEGDLKAGGAALGKGPVERDGKVITGVGPQAAGAFGKALVEALSK
ncbi:MAG: DJ-1/PfpI family protein [Planctomycetes bacterium]|nr:DJ-1/PfpI family protein [Planctomycetota bacterium]